MAELNYESLVAQLIKPLVTHPDEVCTTSFIDEDKVLVKALVHQDDLGKRVELQVQLER